MEQIRVVIKEPNQKAEIREIDNSSEAVKKVLQGGMEAWSINDRVAIYCNSESAHNGMPFNCKVGEWEFKGTIIVLNFDDNGHYSTFPLEQAEVIAVLLS